MAACSTLSSRNSDRVPLVARDIPSRPDNTTLLRRHTISKSTAVAKRDDTSAEVATVDPAIEAILAAQNEEDLGDLLTTPLLKIAQPLTREVQDEQAEPGEFIDTSTGEGLGTKVEFILAYRQKGRFAVDRENNRSYAANGTDVIPDHWSDYVGEEFVGQPFAEHPDAEEQYKKRVNAKEIPWGSGPPINTTFVFTGLALVENIESGEVEVHPVRLSLKRSDIPAARKWITLIQSKLRNKPSWDKTFVLETQKKSYEKGMAYNIVVSTGRDTTAEEKQQALELAQSVLAGRVVDNEASAGRDEQVEPDAKGGLGL